jgi:hypothetical protein
VRKPIQGAEIFAATHKYLGVRYVYEEETANREPRTMNRETVLMPEAVAALPREALARVEEAVLEGDVDVIEQVIEDIRAIEAGVADALAPLAQQFEYDTMLAVIQEAKGMTHK